MAASSKGRPSCGSSWGSRWRIYSVGYSDKEGIVSKRLEPTTTTYEVVVEKTVTVEGEVKP